MQFVVAHLMSGSCLAFADGLTGFEAVVDFVASQRINYIGGVPVHASAFLELAREGELLFPGVDVLQLSSTLVPETLRHKIRHRLTPNLCVFYGMVEVGVITAAPPALLASDVPGSVGKPAPGITAQVIDDQGAVVPSGTAGRLRVKSAGLIGGYFGDPEETARSFRDGWFYTGDRAELTPQGTLIHHGRADDMIIYDGMNIYPAEIENVLLKHPAVTDVVALAVALKRRGTVPVAAVVLGSAVTETELMSHCRSWLGTRSPITVKSIREFPRNQVGKVRRQELAIAIGKQIIEDANNKSSSS